MTEAEDQNVPASSGDDVTRLLREIEDGRDGAMERLMAVVYADLERVAEKHMRQRFGRGAPGVTLEPAALVNESWFQLIRQRCTYDNRGHFFAIATRVMLRVLTDYQRRRGAARRGGAMERVTLSLAGAAASDRGAGPETLIGVDSLVAALERLETLDARKADVVKLRVVWAC